MEAKEFVDEFKRMFGSLGWKPNKIHICEGVTCSECPFNAVEQGVERCILIFECIDEVIDVVTTWSAEHPKKTNKDVLLEKFPDSRMNPNGSPVVCAYHLGIVPDRDGCTSCSECWNEEYMEVNND